MCIEPKLIKPINIRLSKSINEIMPDDYNTKSYSLKPGAVIGGNSYGFIIIRDTKNYQKETIYSI